MKSILNRSLPLVLLLSCVLQAQAVSASSQPDLKPLPDRLRQRYEKAVKEYRSTGHSRSLLAGLECVNNAPFLYDYYDGTCKTLTKRDESHWCDAEAFGLELADYMGYPYPEDYSDELAAYVADYNDIDISSGRFCIAGSKEDCCMEDAGPIAGVVVGGFLGIVGIVVLLAFLCKCCCFRPKQILVMQQPPAVAMQQQPQVVVVPAGAR